MPGMVDEQDVRVPDGTCLVHIGPHKTGTTSVQSAFHLARRAAAAQGVQYGGSERHAVVAVQAAIDPDGPLRGGLRRWRALLDEVARAAARVTVLSSEWFADAEDAAIRRIVAELGAERTHVAVTVRSLERVIPSQWQQYVAAGLGTSYEPWLHSVLDAPAATGAAGFWRRHRHDRLIARWAEVVGPANVTAIVVDDRDHGAVLRAFERLSGLETGTLVAEDDRQNRSLTLPEAELLRAFNQRLHPEVTSRTVRLNLGLYGAAAALRARMPGAEEPRIHTPSWAIERARQIGAEIVAGVRASGVRVIGDLDTLVAARADPTRTNNGAPVDRHTWLDVGSAAAIGVLATSGLGRGRRTGAGHRRVKHELESVSTERLARVVVHRLRSVPSLVRRGLSPRGRAADARDWAAQRAPTELEGDVLRSFEAAVAADGLSAALAREVIRRGVLPEMLRTEPLVPSDDAWREAGAALLMGIAGAAGLLRTRPGRRFAPPAAAVETLDVARASTFDLARLVARRILVRAFRRGRGA